MLKKQENKLGRKYRKKRMKNKKKEKSNSYKEIIY